LDLPSSFITGQQIIKHLGVFLGMQVLFADAQALLLMPLLQLQLMLCDLLYKSKDLLQWGCAPLMT